MKLGEACLWGWLTLSGLDQGDVTYGLVRRDREWWDYALWRATKTVFFMPFPYRVLSFLRRWTYDAVALLPLIAAGVWWVTVSAGTDVPAASVQTADGMEQFLLSHHVSRFYPTLIAFLLCVIILRTGRAETPRRSRLKVSIAQRIPVGVVVFLAALAVIDLILVPGPLAERATPCVVAAIWGWLIRSQVYGRVRVLEATDAGFRPPVSVAFHRRSRRFARRCLTSTWQSTTTMASVRAGIDAASQYFASRKQTHLRAWCLARAVDYNLRVGALDEAETILDDARRSGLAGEPCLRAAQGLFDLATGNDAASSAFAETEALCRENGRHVPFRLRTLRAESGIQGAAGQGFSQLENASGTRRRTGRTRTLLAWDRQYATITQDILAETFTLQRRDADLAAALAVRVEGLIDALGKDSAQSDLTAQEAVSLQLVKGASRERLGAILAEQGRFREAAAAYSAAAAIYRERKYRPRAGFAAASGALLALRSGLAAGDAAVELGMLTALLTGLQAMEYDRGRLREDELRAQLLVSRETLYSEAFRVLAEHVIWQRDKAAEIALWLLESVHRNKLADTISASQDAGRPPGDSPSDEALRRLREPVDVARIRQVVTGRAALYYRCDKASDGWRITTVLAAPSGIKLHHALLPAVPPPTGRVTAMRQPAGLLDQLASGDEYWVSMVHRTIELGHPVWAGLAAALLPPELAGVLRSLSSGKEPAILLVVPDGPLSSVPFAGLRLQDGTAIADHAAVVFMPNLVSFSAADWTGKPHSAGCVVVGHFGPTKFSSAFNAQRGLARYEPARLTVRVTAGRAAFLYALRQPPAPRIAVISNHGHTAASPANRYIEFEDGSLSEPEARAIRWPQAVVLGSCWASEVTVRAGKDPVGMPTACLLGGARVVLGGQSVIDNDETSAHILAKVTLETALGRHPALALRDAVAAHLAARPEDRHAHPYKWANMTVWTSLPPTGPADAKPTWTSWTTSLTARGPGIDNFPVFSTKLAASRTRTPVRYLAIPAGPTLQRAVDHAMRASVLGRPVTTLDLTTAILETDNADWTSFVVGADLRSIPHFGEAGMPASQESIELGRTTIALDLDHQVIVTKATAAAIGWAERLATQLRDTFLTPAHLVYGMLCRSECDATRWMTSGSHDIHALIALLSERVFAVDLPPSTSLAPAGKSPVRPLPTRARGKFGPGPSSEVLALIASTGSRGDSNQHGDSVLTTLAFMGAMAAADHTAWRHLTEAGFRLNPPDVAPFAERDQGGQLVPLGQGLSATVTLQFADAFQTGAALAYHLGDSEITPAHVLYGLLTDHDNDAFRWLARDSASTDEARRPETPRGPVSVLADRIFQCPLPAPTQIPAAPKPQAPGAFGPWLFLLPLLLLPPCWRAVRKVGTFTVGLSFFVLLAVTMSLADINTAASNATQLTYDHSLITGSLRLSGYARGDATQATLIGPLSTFYTDPVVLGWKNVLRATLFDWGSPGDISGLYLFTLPTPPHPPSSAQGWLTYRGGSYRAEITCQGFIASKLCLAVVKLPGGTAPSGFSWIIETLNNGNVGTDASQMALIYPQYGRPGTVIQADIQVLAQTPDGTDILGVRTQSGQPIRPGSPVVLAGRSRQLPLLGIAIPGTPWDTVFPMGVINSYAIGVADKLAGPVAGAVPYMGIEYTADSLPGPAVIGTVLVGSPADDAGLQAGDDITAISGQPIISPADVHEIIAQHRPGQTIAITIIRRRVRHTIVLTLGYQ